MFSFKKAGTFKQSRDCNKYGRIDGGNVKSFFIWIGSVVLGAAIGYGLSYLVTMNLYLLIALGVIIGSSIGVTWNIHREKEHDFEDIEMDEIIEPSDTPSQSKIKQITS